VTEVENEQQQRHDADTRRQCLCETFARVTERSALAGARWLGRADQEAAEDAAFSGARLALERMPIEGHIVIGASEGAEQLAAGSTIGAASCTTSRSIRSRDARSSPAAGRTRSR
jgi:fructose-1,6-bisphosphatase/sedoheptulose 1,7-bisphosphatase-like protein